MFNFIKKSFANKLIATISIGLFLAVFMSLVVEYLSLKSFQGNTAEEYLTRESVGVAKNLAFLFEEVEKDLISISLTPPIGGIIRATDNKGLDELGGSTFEQWADRLENIFIGLAESKLFYDQIRYIDDYGDELVRVNVKDGFIDPVVNSSLQNKGDRYYFTETINYERGNIYTSRIDLNREGEDQLISEPYSLVLRYGVPVTDIKGNNRAVIVINANVQRIFDKLQNEFSERDFIVIDNQGNYLHHQDESKLYGSENDLDTDENFQKDFGLDNFNVLVNSNEGSFKYEDNFVSYAKSPYCVSDDMCLYVFQVVSQKEIFAVLSDITIKTIIYDVTLMMALMFFLWFVVHKYTKPIDEMIDYIHDVDLGKKTKYMPEGDDEIAGIGVALKDLISKLSNVKNSVEEQVKTQTLKLEQEKETTKKQQTVVMNMLEDIKEEKEKVEVANIKIETFLRSIGDGLIITDQDGKITFVNQGAEALLTLPQSELMGKTLIDSVPLYDGNGEVVPVSGTPQIKALVKFTKIESDEFFYKRGKELFPIFMTVNPITLGTRSIGTVQVFRDITNEKEIDRAKTEFISLASHQLRTPLTAMNWYIEMLGDSKDKLDEESNSYVEEVERASKRLISIVNSLLNISRIELGNFAVDPEEVNLQEVVEGVLKDLAPKINDKGHEIKEVYKKRALDVIADPKLTQMVIQNLVSNAVKYTPEKGKITISVYKQKYIEESKDNMGAEIEEVVCEVSDNGIGIPKQEQGKMFNKMFRAENAAELTNDGNGLGLYIVKGIVEAQGGRIWFESEKDKGTKFFFTIPAEGVKKVKGSKTLDDK